MSLTDYNHAKKKLQLLETVNGKQTNGRNK